MYPIKKDAAETLAIFVHDAAGDAVTGLTNGSFTKRISKGSGAWAAMTAVITEMENGWYSFPLSVDHTDTLGVMSITFTNAGAKQVNLQYKVHESLPDDLATYLHLIKQAVAGKAVVSVDDLTVTIYDEDKVTVLLVLDVTADGRTRTPQ